MYCLPVQQESSLDLFALQLGGQLQDGSDSADFLFPCPLPFCSFLVRRCYLVQIRRIRLPFRRFLESQQNPLRRNRLHLFFKRAKRLEKLFVIQLVPKIWLACQLLCNLNPTFENRCNGSLLNSAQFLSIQLLIEGRLLLYRLTVSTYSQAVLTLSHPSFSLIFAVVLQYLKTFCLFYSNRRLNKPTSLFQFLSLRHTLFATFSPTPLYTIEVRHKVWYTRFFENGKGTQSRETYRSYFDSTYTYKDSTYFTYFFLRVFYKKECLNGHGVRSSQKEIL